MKKVLVTGGCGFIGSHLIERLLAEDYEVIILDNLSVQVHRDQMIIPEEILKKCLFIKEDVLNVETVSKALKDVSIIIHLAAETGVGQSMYEIGRYTSVNVAGTGRLLDLLFSTAKKVEKFVLASSRAVYGEGTYACRECGPIRPQPRTQEDLKAGKWEPGCPRCGAALEPVPTMESSQTEPTSIYGITKLTQEQLVKMSCDTLGIESVILRFQNVYGPRQSLSNPYTGILSVFSTRIRNQLPLEIYEDGLMSRDFIHVADVVESILLGLKTPGLFGEVFNVGTGVRTSVLDIANELKKVFDSDVPLQYHGYYRIGDIRHCFADISRAGARLGFEPKYGIREGLRDLGAWVLGQPRGQDLSEKAFEDLVENKIYR